ncbi:F-box protein At4g35930-like isoform X2 [Asparagus officinalis]|uniref:F-box protein At4g35930-like isoform X2 n=1 Tax=Asparagus officinalis TaxID=4686 RepID=UPI00098DEAD9|nr:F-box protein At4g35930-like isoform X2 [Asparagus officinalis]
MVFDLFTNENNKRKPSIHESMAFKQKKRVKSSRNKYLKPGALAQIRYSRMATRSSTDTGREVLLETEDQKVVFFHKGELIEDQKVDSSHKREPIEDQKVDIFQKRELTEDQKVNIFHKGELVVHNRTPAASPSRTQSINLQSAGKLGDETKQQMLPTTPKTPDAGCESQSRLESLPIDLLVKILCHLHHDQLRAVFHVSQRVRMAVLVAREWYFNYTTPDRSRQAMLRAKTPLPTERWPFIRGIRISSPHTPKAPRQGRRPSRLYSTDIKQTAAALFRDTTFLSSYISPLFPRPVLKPVASNRVLFCEEELCKAVAKNKLR